MKFLLVCILAISFGLIGFGFSSGEKGTYVDSVKFIQYLDENTALEEVRNGNLDLYYYRIASDRIENTKSRQGLQVFESTGGSYSILVNPAVSEEFNPFSIREVRFALNYLVDRKLIVNELMGGFGTTMISNYGTFDPDYPSIINQLESFHFRYNPVIAEEIISSELQKIGAKKIDGKWIINENPIELTFFIRSDDPVRKSIGEIISSELERIGFTIKKDFGDLNKAFVVVYGSDPADLKWNLYTEGWGGRSAFVKYDSVGLGQMYSPWFSTMPGFNDPSYWNYQNDKLDTITQNIYTGNFSSAEERTSLIQEATLEAVNESVRIFLASKLDQYVVNEKINGIINDFGAGVPSRFTPINSRGDSDTLVIGVKQIYQGAWNPVMGLSDAYSKQIWDILYDPAIFKHPYTGESFPIRTHWDVETAGPEGKLTVPADAIIWDPMGKEWKNVDPQTLATSKVTFDLKFSNWHHGQKMDMNDILHSLYFTLEWGSEQTENDKTFDSEFTPRASQVVNTLIGVRPIGEDKIEVYVDYWHFDENEIADWATLWNTMPWELFSAMEQAVIDGKVSFSRSGAVSKNANWLSLIVPNDSQLIKEYLEEFKKSNFVPKPLESFGYDKNYFDSRYGAAIDWITKNNHAVISNGPFYLESYSPESRTIMTRAFVDDTYPFAAGYWKEFEEVQFPQIMGVDIPEVVVKGKPLEILITSESTSEIQYFLTNSQGKIVASEKLKINENPTILRISDDKTNLLGVGANDLKLFGVSESVLRPDIFTSSFFVVENEIEKLPAISVSETKPSLIVDDSFLIIVIISVIILAGFLIYFKSKKTKKITST